MLIGGVNLQRRSPERFLKKPALFFRTNTLRITPELLVAELEREGVVAKQSELCPESLLVELPKGLSLPTLNSYVKGLFSVQDLSETIVGRIAAPQPTERIVDLCAGPGGKATHLSMLLGDAGEVVALDVNEKRAELVRKNAERLGCTNVTVLTKDALQFRGERFDLVLLDAPCTGSGVFHKKVDARWRLTEDELEGVKLLQYQLLKHSLDLVKPGGRIVYSTCSMEPDENEMQLSRLMQEFPSVKIRPLPSWLSSCVERIPSWDFRVEGALTTYPNIHGSAGGFVAAISPS